MLIIKTELIVSKIIFGVGWIVLIIVIVVGILFVCLSGFFFFVGFVWILFFPLFWQPPYTGAIF